MHLRIIAERPVAGSAAECGRAGDDPGKCDRWLHPVDEQPNPLTIEERGAVLVELLDISDALPPVPRRDLDAPSFRELCERR
jgi:hypothetical protein